MLKDRILPTTLQSCWFQRSVLVKLGKFDVNVQLENLLDIFCRLFQDSGASYASTPRVLVDDERRLVAYRLPLRYLYENLVILSRHFGWWAACYWLIRQKPRLLFQYFLRRFCSLFHETR